MESNSLVVFLTTSDLFAKTGLLAGSAPESRK